MLDPISTIKKGIDTVGDLAETAAKPVETAAGEAVKLGANIADGASNTLIAGEKLALNPFTVATGVAPGLVGTLEGKLAGLLKNPFTDITKLLGDDSLGRLLCPYHQDDSIHNLGKEVHIRHRQNRWSIENHNDSAAAQIG